MRTNIPATKRTTDACRAAAGRPRCFDEEDALDRALEVFWQKGFEGTTLPDLTAAMGINRPSLYAAFGNKEALFEKALSRYIEGPAAYTKAALALPTARAVAEQLLRGAARLLTDPKHPRGCFIVQGALACGNAASASKQSLSDKRLAGEYALRQRFERARREGDLPPHADCAGLARFVSAATYGMSIQAADGATRAQLNALVDITLRAWPE